MPPLAIRKPAKMNKGIASNEKELAVVAIWINKTWGGDTLVKSAERIAASPSAIDIGTSRNSRARKANESIVSAIAS